jgi:hypothetical protein
MIDVQVDGREVCVRLTDDVWQMLEPGTLCLTVKQAQVLRRALNSLNDYQPLDEEAEDG